jgi:hypothetical protein
MEHLGYWYCSTRKDAERLWMKNFHEKCEHTGKTICLATDHFGEYARSKIDPWADGIDCIESLPLPKTKAEVLNVLNAWACHPDNG